MCRLQIVSIWYQITFHKEFKRDCFIEMWLCHHDSLLKFGANFGWRWTWHPVTWWRLLNACWDGTLPLLLYGNRAIRKHARHSIPCESTTCMVCAHAEWQQGRLMLPHYTVNDTLSWPQFQQPACCITPRLCTGAACPSLHPACELHHIKPVHHSSSSTAARTIIFHRTLPLL